MDDQGTDRRQSRWDRHHLTRREHILDAALEVLEDAAPGAEVRVRHVAQAAGLSRTVVYRYFSDRAQLDIAVRARIIEQLRGELVPALSLDGTPIDIIRRIVTAYAGWVSAHPALHRFAEQEVPVRGSTSQMEAAIEQVARQIEDILGVGVQVLGAELDADDRAALDPLVFGLVGFGITAVRRWVSRPVREPAAPQFVERLTEGLFLQIAGMAAARGVDLAPDVGVEQLLAAALDRVEP